jgi:hypothetical protein
LIKDAHQCVFFLEEKRSCDFSRFLTRKLTTEVVITINRFVLLRIIPQSANHDTLKVSGKQHFIINFRCRLMNKIRLSKVLCVKCHLKIVVTRSPRRINLISLVDGRRKTRERTFGAAASKTMLASPFLWILQITRNILCPLWMPGIGDTNIEPA